MRYITKQFSGELTIEKCRVYYTSSDGQGQSQLSNRLEELCHGSNVTVLGREAYSP